MEFSNTISDLGTRVETSQPVSTAHFCVVCLVTDCKLYPLSKYGLADAYHNLTDKSLLCNMNCAPKCCTECAQRLINCDRFRDKSLRSYNLLLDLFEKKAVITTEDIKATDRTKHQLTSNIDRKIYKPDHCDSYLIHNQFEQIKIELELDSKSKIKTLNDFNSDEEFLVDDVDNGSEFLDDNIKTEHTDNIDRFTIFQNEKSDNITVNKNDVAIDNVIKNSSLIDSKVDNKKCSVNKLVIVHSNDIKAVIDNKTNTKTRKVAIKKEKAAPKPKKLRTHNEKTPEKPGKADNQCYLKYFEVTKLSHEEQVAMIQRRKEADNFKSSVYKCMMCYKVFTCVSSYDRHMEKHTDKYGPIACEVCGIHCNTKTQMRQHKSKVHDMRFNCRDCDFVTTAVQTARTHARWHDGVTYKCKHCEQTYSKRTSYLTHLRTAHVSDSVCTLCGFTFINEYGLRMHLLRKHRSEDVQNDSGPQCKFCKLRFASHAAYQQHLEVSHNIHGPALTRNSRQTMYNTNRQDVQTVECELCGTKLKGFKLYACHFTRLHPDKQPSQQPTKTQPSTPKLFLCHQCGKSFQNTTQLRDHIRSHNGERRYQCDTCDKRFVGKINLVKHMQLHSNTRHQCNMCGKTFSDKSNAKRHILTHSADTRPYHKCDVCDKSFTTAQGRNEHVLHVHSNVPRPKRVRAPRPAP
ncbi:zinc finger protein ZFP2 isoform X2 [Bicyclus anynana]|uniref:Zinc finger protein ZFP2 isoform X2 n=1 Tax=Bicyclus anynana TaxID=110368 RepID=A0ABM3M468_BICAN|nr:zinc finger protein ZFP2 isoform X2 [Bicyclus anynana]